MGRRHGRDISGILLLDKPCGLSSNAALQRAKRTFQAMKAGHTGSLDVQASGLLPICFGEATKICQFLLDADKRYVSDFRLGQRTTTGDSEGAVTERRPTMALRIAEIEAVCRAFLGQINQIPPMHSAIKQNGKRLYKLAHRGIEVPRESRPVTIHALDIVRFDEPVLTVDVRCSKGTYIRTLAEDIGEALGCGGYVSALRREEAGPYALKQASTLEELDAYADQGTEVLDRLLLPIDSALGGMSAIVLDATAVLDVSRGQTVIAPPGSTWGMARLYDESGRFIGVGEVVNADRVAPRRIFRTQVSDTQSVPIQRTA